MKSNIHPKYSDVFIKCSCGNNFVSKSTFNKEVINIDICSSCHPFYTGKQKIVDTAGRVEKFNNKFNKLKS